MTSMATIGSPAATLSAPATKGFHFVAHGDDIRITCRQCSQTLSYDIGRPAPQLISPTTTVSQSESVVIHHAPGRWERLKQYVTRFFRH
jgi:hypothetical protein